MDILKPDLLWIDGRCFRIPLNSPLMQSDIDNGEASGNYDYEGTEFEVDESCDDFKVDFTENGRCRTSFHISSSFFSYIIGAKGSTKHRLEDETSTQIRVPKQGQDGEIVIIGSDEKGVSAARRRINLIVSSCRFKQQCTHFLSIPMTGTQIMKRFLAFKEEVCKICNHHRIDESIFQKPEKLHLTLGTMVLVDRKECSQVADLLNNFKETIAQPMLKNQPLKLSMVGIEYMNDDPTDVDILYGNVQLTDSSDNNVLQLLADNLVDYFCKKGFMQKQYNHVKLHVTLMNTLFRKNQDGVSEMEKSNQKKKARETFDATTILKEFGGYNFGELVIDGIHLSQRYTTAANGYYQLSTEMKLT